MKKANVKPKLLAKPSNYTVRFRVVQDFTGTIKACSEREALEIARAAVKNTGLKSMKAGKVLSTDVVSASRAQPIKKPRT